MAYTLPGADEAVAVPSNRPVRAGGRTHGCANRFAAVGLWIAGFEFRREDERARAEALGQRRSIRRRRALGHRIRVPTRG